MQYTSRILHSTIKNARKPKLMSQILCYPEAIPKEKSAVSSCKSLKLMLHRGLIKHVSPGIFSLMPLTLRSLKKLCDLIVMSMDKVNGQKVIFPTLIQDSLMKTSGRWEGNTNLFKLKDRHASDYCLGPTHEEIATSLMAKLRVTYKYLPLRLYQISTKFRDEMNPKLGLLRGREFLMKDMYTFDTNEENSQITYNAVCDAYSEFFQLLGISHIKVKGSSGDIGGKKSHEFQLPSVIGEDEIYHCPKCKEGMNSELLEKSEPVCSTCNIPLQKCAAIEVGHAFLLGTTYSDPFQAQYDTDKHVFRNLEMGCYGLGVSRILAASIEHLSTADNIRWPFLIAPFYISVIPPKKGSKEESIAPLADSIAESLSKIDWLTSNIVIDDRTHFTIGKRVQEASGIGIPYVIVVGKHAQGDTPKFEIIDTYSDQTHMLSLEDTLQFFMDRNSLLDSHCNITT
ncbi:hypothetical protein JTE90_016686 [Oedothorax gibbosus]|uniref:Probable proline--tRNA ligase, mitochondrial n=1 Tax=Oedothorax gibbosus TaxID=931172 RepID=A0AAV6TUW4_9ARAC|nr:hypothetical protein JTE90_016686 [Oedothorax gibbosus]